MATEKKGFLSSIGGMASKLVMTEVDGPSVASNHAPEQPAQVFHQPPSTPPQVFPTQQVVEGPGVDHDLLNMLKGKIDRKNPPGYDYIEFGQAIVKMATILKTTDPSVVFPATFASVEPMGVTKDYLVKTADMCVGILDDEKASFDKEITKQNSGTEGKKNQLLEIDSKIKLLSDEIQKLSAQKVEVTSSIDQDFKDLQIATSKFTTAYEAYKNKILSDKTNISKYL